MRAFTKREWRAIRDALAARLTGEIDVEDDEHTPKRADYESALEKAQERLQ